MCIGYSPHRPADVLNRKSQYSTGPPNSELRRQLGNKLDWHTVTLLADTNKAWNYFPNKIHN